MKYNADFCINLWKPFNIGSKVFNIGRYVFFMQISLRVETLDAFSWKHPDNTKLYSNYSNFNFYLPISLWPRTVVLELSPLKILFSISISSLSLISLSHLSLSFRNYMIEMTFISISFLFFPLFIFSIPFLVSF